MTKPFLGDDPFSTGDAKSDKPAVAATTAKPEADTKSKPAPAAAKASKPAATKKKSDTPAATKSVAKAETPAPVAAKPEKAPPPVAAKPEKAPTPVAAKVEKAPPPAAVKAEAPPPVAVKAEKAPPPVAAKAETPPPVAAKVEAAAPPVAVAPEAAPPVTPQPPPLSTTSVPPTAAPTPTTRADTGTTEYGPSIDRPPPPGHRQGILDEVRNLEERVRQTIAPEERRPAPPVLGGVWRAWRSLAMRDRSDVVDEFGRDPNVAARMDPLLDFLYKNYFRVEAEGLGHIPDQGRALIVANHSGTLPYDGAMIMHAVRREHDLHRSVRPLVEDFVFHFPYLGTLMNRIGGVRACQENAARLLEADQLVAVFPEGIKGVGKLFAQRYQLQRFGRGGFIKLALATDAPIIPTAVVGAEEIHPMLSKVTWLAKSFGIPYLPITPTFPWLGPIGLLPLPTKWFIAFGEPLYFNVEYGAEAASDRILVNKLAEQVRQRIQEMIDRLLKDRRSVLFG